MSKITHGLANHKLYKIWHDQKLRCTSDKHPMNQHYKLRGISFSKEFYDFPVWLEYIESLDDAYTPTYSIDRIDNNKGYERGNLRWTSKAVQTRNTVKLRKSNKSGYRGVSYSKRDKVFRVEIRVNYKKKYLGVFRYPWTAAYAYDAFVLKHNLEHTRNFT